ncbi:MAG: YihY/virulence factor BrkB family protein, partial [Pseudomonadota bacterium]
EPVKRPNRLIRIKRVTMDAIEHFLNDEALMTASALAFTLILALFPFLIFITAVASLLGGEELATTISAGLFDVLPGDIARALEPQVRRVIGTRSGGFLTFGLVITIFSLTTAIESIRAGLNRAYSVKETRNVIITRIESLLFVLIGSLTLLIVALLAVVAPLSYEWLEGLFPDLVPWRVIYDAIRLLLLAAILYGALVALHVALPRHRRGPKQVWIGCLVTLLLWYAAGLGFSFYLSNFSNYAATYAGLAGVVAALMFFYICSACLLFGGEVNRAIAVSRRRYALEKRGLAVPQ